MCKQKLGQLFTKQILQQRTFKSYNHVITIISNIFQTLNKPLLLVVKDQSIQIILVWNNQLVLVPSKNGQKFAAAPNHVEEAADGPISNWLSPDLENSGTGNHYRSIKTCFWGRVLIVMLV